MVVVIGAIEIIMNSTTLFTSLSNEGNILYKYKSTLIAGIPIKFRRQQVPLSHKSFGRRQIAKFTGPSWGPPWSCRPHVDPMNIATRGVLGNIPGCLKR